MKNMKLLRNLPMLCTVAILGCASTPKPGNEAIAELMALLDFAPTTCPENPDCHCIGVKAKSSLLPLRYSTAQFCPVPLSDKSLKNVAFDSWDQAGNKVDHGLLFNGEMHGLWTSWHPNGRISGQATFERGLQHGHFTQWHENGQISLEGQFDHGKEDGQWLIYSEDGKLSRRMLWNAGKLISRSDD